MADGSLFYYENTGRLLESEFLGGTDDNTTYLSIINNTKKAYLTTVELKRFDWSPASVLNLVPKGYEVSAEDATMVELLPSTDFTNQLSAQIDKCLAMAIEILAENHYTAINTPDNNTDKVSIEKWWQLYYHLQWEISKAERDTEILKLDAKSIFDEANNYVINSNTPENMRYINAFQSSCDIYIDRLEQISMYLEQAQEASWKLRCYLLSTATIN